jgi:hypothetical protein
MLAAAGPLSAADGAAIAPALEGNRSVVAITADGARVPLGMVQFAPAAGDRVAFRLALDTSRLTDFFLSMREFKCLDAAAEVTCHVPYPYAHPGTVSRNDLAWLEHQLLFFYKRPSDFGAKLWNGVVFRFEPEGTRWVGRPQAIDLNLIGEPPANPAVPPFGPARRDEMPPDSRWLRALVIE